MLQGIVSLLVSVSGIQLGVSKCVITPINQRVRECQLLILHWWVTERIYNPVLMVCDLPENVVCE